MKKLFVVSLCVFTASSLLAETPPVPSAVTETKKVEPAKPNADASKQQQKPAVTTEKEITTSGENSNSGRANQPSLPNPVDGRAMPGSPAQEPANLVPDGNKGASKHQGSVNPVQPAPVPAKEQPKQK